MSTEKANISTPFGLMQVRHLTNPTFLFLLSRALDAISAHYRVRSVREECLDHVLILGERHLHRVLKEYVSYFNQARPHQSIAQQIPAGDRHRIGNGPVRCRDVLGGVIHDYYRLAA